MEQREYEERLIGLLAIVCEGGEEFDQDKYESVLNGIDDAIGGPPESAGFHDPRDGVIAWKLLDEMHTRSVASTSRAMIAGGRIAMWLLNYAADTTGRSQAEILQECALSLPADS